ncbi:hypothetical protein FRB99_006732 [Tulasnella sp. 403]|nr:hypothetical protein FRB99_006732 [Tulasnella sp. 403]
MASLSQKSVYVLGATGYIGGSVLVGFKQRYPEFSYTATVRNPKDIPALEAVGVKVIQASHQGVDVIEKIAYGHDIVVNCADADDLPLTTAIIKGLAQRRKDNAADAKPILIHTSGSGVVSSSADGAFHPGVDDKIYDDNSVEDIKGIAPTQPHRDVDLQIFAASEADLIDAYLIAPSTIYGKGRGPVRNMSVQVNELIRISVRRKQAVVAGEGTNRWGSVHIDDLVELYGLVLDLALSGDNTNRSYANFFWGTTAEYVWGDIARELARLLHKRGLVSSAEAHSVPAEEVPRYIVTNSRTVANRSLALGWKIGSQKSLIEALPEEIDLTLAQM